MPLFSKIITKTFGAYDFLLYLCKRFRNKKAMASKSFFEKIYIDREVVQEEASAADIFFIGRWMGKETNRSIFFIFCPFGFIQIPVVDITYIERCLNLIL